MKCVLMILAASLLAIGSSSSARAQELLLTTASTAIGGSTPSQSVSPGEILGLEYSAPGTAHHVLTVRNVAALLGDVDGNGLFDDGWGVIDALSESPTGQGGVLGLLLSTRTSVTFADGTTVLDGDVFTVQPGGAVSVVMSETQFANLTSTSSVDVDALHVDASGVVYFSFDNDEITQSPALIAQNGGSATLDETCVFRWAPGDSEASLFLSRSAVLQLVNNALGTSLTTVVDTTGITEDPSHPGAFLIALGSTNSVLEGTLFSTFGQGEVATSAGIPLDSTTLGFSEQEALGALTISVGGPRSTIHAPAAVAIGPGAQTIVSVAPVTPFATIRLVASRATFPTLPAMSFSGFAGFNHVFLDVSDPFVVQSLQDPTYETTASAGGDASFSFDTTNVPPGLSVVVQAFAPLSLVLTPPAVIQS